MSYARFAEDSDVYVYADVNGYIACCGCILGDKWDYHSIAEIIEHMQEHVDAGHKIRDYLLDAETYDEHDFVAMCMTYLCREDEGHAGPHTPVRSERDQQVRDNSEVRKLETMLRNRATT